MGPGRSAVKRPDTTTSKPLSIARACERGRGHIEQMDGTLPGWCAGGEEEQAAYSLRDVSVRVLVSGETARM
eukprot:426165-Prymnesium_polylepis.1